MLIHTRSQTRSKQPGLPARPDKGTVGAREAPAPPFSDALCAVDGSRGSAEAVRQAVALCGPTAGLELVAVSNTVGTGLSAQADLGEEHAREALEEAAQRARNAGLIPSTELLHGARVSDRLLAESAGHDLLAIGCHGGSRLGGLMLGSTATQLAHRAELPLLIARRSADDNDSFPQDLVLASDGSPGSWAAMEMAARIAQARGSALRVVFVPDGHPERYRQLFKQLTALERALGSTPAFIDAPGDPARQIATAARAAQSSLIVIGKRGLRGLKSLGSVSELVVHRAPCSVLVVPPPASASD
jgi:nucleotide-binding universal stress UspA family protein